MFFCPVQQKSLRERWLLDGAAGSEQDEAKKQLAEDEAKLKGMEENIIRYVYNLGTTFICFWIHSISLVHQSLTRQNLLLTWSNPNILFSLFNFSMPALWQCGAAHLLWLRPFCNISLKHFNKT